ncbi:MAG: hypothetical protein KJO06_06335 [Gemmatimonadetes bacterium]|nr:hypothetical protein [Gemmatimonadota bacterium]
MRPWIQWTLRLAGLLLTGTGLVATWQVLAPGSDLTTITVDGWMFEGPALITFGLLLMWAAGTSGEGESSLESRGPALLMQIGIGFMFLPAVAWVWNAAAGTMASSYAWSFAAFSLGVPGFALLLTGAALWSWRKVRNR